MKGLSEVLKNSDNVINGVAAAPGIVIGKVHLYHRELISVDNQDIEDVDEAIDSFREAIAKAKKELSKIFELARQKMGEARAEIFSAQLMILDDPILIGTIEDRIRKEKKLPEYIVNDEISKFQDLMVVAEEFYLKERALDIGDIKNRIIRNVQKKRLISKITPGVIVVSESLTPADTILFSKSEVKAFVTDRGGLTSHTAIVARSLDIPAVVGTHDATHTINQGDLIIVDGFNGHVFVNPNESQLKFFNEKITLMLQINEEMKDLVNKPCQTLDGHDVSVFANLDVTEEISHVVANKAHGIGLYRTEQIIEELGELPDENEQYQIYSKLASKIYPRTITIRAFDIGGDKVKIWEFKEANPFLGLRGIRFLLENEPIFMKQIKAILRANIHHNVHFMIPMISTVKEVLKVKQLIKVASDELNVEKYPHSKSIKLGIMIEVPSAALMVKELAKEVDFLSIGTNDLIQYIMAVDRGNDTVSNLYQEFHPAILRTLHHIITEAALQNKPVSICGEMAADNQAVPLLVGLGFTSLSVSPSAMLPIKRTIRALSYEAAKVLAEKCLACDNEDDVIKHVSEFFENQHIPRTRTIL